MRNKPTAQALEQTVFVSADVHCSLAKNTGIIKITVKN